MYAWEETVLWLDFFVLKTSRLGSQIVREGWLIGRDGGFEIQQYSCAKHLQDWSPNFHKEFKLQLADCKKEIAWLRRNSRGHTKEQLRQVE